MTNLNKSRGACDFGAAGVSVHSLLPFSVSTASFPSQCPQLLPFSPAGLLESHRPIVFHSGVLRPQAQLGVLCSGPGVYGQEPVVSQSHLEVTPASGAAEPRGQQFSTSRAWRTGRCSGLGSGRAAPSACPPGCSDTLLVARFWDEQSTLPATPSCCWEVVHREGDVEGTGTVPPRAGLGEVPVKDSLLSQPSRASRSFWPLHGCLVRWLGCFYGTSVEFVLFGRFTHTASSCRALQKSLVRRFR